MCNIDFLSFKSTNNKRHTNTHTHTQVQQDTHFHNNSIIIVIIAHRSQSQTRILTQEDILLEKERMLKRRKYCLCSDLTPRSPSFKFCSHTTVYCIYMFWCFDEKGKRRWWHFTCCSQHYTIHHDIFALLSDSYVSLNFFNEDALEAVYTRIYYKEDMMRKKTWSWYATYNIKMMMFFM